MIKEFIKDLDCNNNQLTILKSNYSESIHKYV
jgi:hypothetical protein